jgi:DNA phosphorothioation-associated putative methyltransferase
MDIRQTALATQVRKAAPGAYDDWTDEEIAKSLQSDPAAMQKFQEAMKKKDYENSSMVDKVLSPISGVIEPVLEAATPWVSAPSTSNPAKSTGMPALDAIRAGTGSVVGGTLDAFSVPTDVMGRGLDYVQSGGANIEDVQGERRGLMEALTGKRLTKSAVEQLGRGSLETKLAQLARDPSDLPKSLGDATNRALRGALGINIHALQSEPDGMVPGQDNLIKSGFNEAHPWMSTIENVAAAPVDLGTGMMGGDPMLLGMGMAGSLGRGAESLKTLERIKASESAAQAANPLAALIPAVTPRTAAMLAERGKTGEQAAALGKAIAGVFAPTMAVGAAENLGAGAGHLSEGRVREALPLLSQGATDAYFAHGSGKHLAEGVGPQGDVVKSVVDRYNANKPVASQGTPDPALTGMRVETAGTEAEVRRAIGEPDVKNGRLRKIAGAGGYAAGYIGAHTALPGVGGWAVGPMAGRGLRTAAERMADSVSGRKPVDATHPFSKPIGESELDFAFNPSQIEAQPNVGSLVSELAQTQGIDPSSLGNLVYGSPEELLARKAGMNPLAGRPADELDTSNFVSPLDMQISAQQQAQRQTAEAERVRVEQEQAAQNDPAIIEQRRQDELKKEYARIALENRMRSERMKSDELTAKEAEVQRVNALRAEDPALPDLVASMVPPKGPLTYEMALAQARKSLGLPDPNAVARPTQPGALSPEDAASSIAAQDPFQTAENIPASEVGARLPGWEGDPNRGGFGGFSPEEQAQLQGMIGPDGRLPGSPDGAPTGPSGPPPPTQGGGGGSAEQQMASFMEQARPVVARLGNNPSALRAFAVKLGYPKEFIDKMLPILLAEQGKGTGSQLPPIEEGLAGIREGGQAPDLIKFLQDRLAAEKAASTPPAPEAPPTTAENARVAGADALDTLEKKILPAGVNPPKKTEGTTEDQMRRRYQLDEEARLRAEARQAEADRAAAEGGKVPTKEELAQTDAYKKVMADHASGTLLDAQGRLVPPENKKNARAIGYKLGRAEWDAKKKGPGDEPTAPVTPDKPSGPSGGGAPSAPLTGLLESLSEKELGAIIADKANDQAMRDAALDLLTKRAAENSAKNPVSTPENQADIDKANVESLGRTTDSQKAELSAKAEAARAANNAPPEGTQYKDATSGEVWTVKYDNSKSGWILESKSGIRTPNRKALESDVRDGLYEPTGKAPKKAPKKAPEAPEAPPAKAVASEPAKAPAKAPSGSQTIRGLLEAGDKEGASKLAKDQSDSPAGAKGRTRGKEYEVGDFLDGTDGKPSNTLVVGVDKDGGLEVVRPKGSAPSETPKGRAYSAEAKPQSKADELGFYSQAERVLSDAKAPTKQRGSAWDAFLRNPQRGITKEEFHWTGLGDFLKKNADSTLTREQISEYLKQNKVEIIEVGNPKAVKIKEPEIEVDYEDGYTLVYAKGEQLLVPLSIKPTTEAMRSRDASSQYIYNHPLSGERYMFSTLGEAVDDAKLAMSNYVKKLKKSNSVAPTTRHSSHTESGPQSNYREIRLTVPRSREGENTFVNPLHYKEPGVVVSFRVNDRKMAGGKTLFVEEVQSDHGSKAKKGVSPGIKRLQEAAEIAQSERQAFREVLSEKRARGESVTVADDLQMKRLRNAAIDTNEAYEAGLKLKDSGAVEDAPFIAETKKYTDLAVKRLLRIAAEEGYDSVAWTTGEQQSRRWSIVQHADRMKYDAKNRRLEAYKGDELVLGRTDIAPEKLADYVGNELAARLLEQPDANWKVTRNEGTNHLKVVNESGVEAFPRRFYSSEADAKAHAESLNTTKAISGDDLKVGSRWAYDYYDKVIPGAFERVGKKFGVKVGQSEFEFLKGSTLDEGSQGWFINRPDGHKATSGDLGIGEQWETNEPVYFDRKSDAEAAAKKVDAAWATDQNQEVGPVKLQSVSLTPEIRERIANEGFAQYSIEGDFQNQGVKGPKSADKELLKLTTSGQEKSPPGVEREEFPGVRKIKPGSPYDVPGIVEGTPRDPRARTTFPEGELTVEEANARAVKDIRANQPISRGEKYTAEGLDYERIPADWKPPTAGEVRKNLPEGLAENLVKVGDGIYETETPNGTVRINMVPSFSVDLEQLEAGREGAKAAYLRGELRVPGEKTTIGGKAVINAVEAGVLPHEAEHVWFDHFASPKQREFLVKKFQSLSEGLKQDVRETIAEAYSAYHKRMLDNPGWQPKTPVGKFIKNIYDFFNGVYRSYRPSVESTFEGIRTGKEFKKAPIKGSDTGMVAKGDWGPKKVGEKTRVGDAYMAKKRVNNDTRPFDTHVTEPTLIAGGSGFPFPSIPASKGGEPSFTLKASHKEGPPRILFPDGTVKELPMRGSARLMGLPDSFNLPADKALARTILGNGIPPDMMRDLVSPMLDGRVKGKASAITTFSGAEVGFQKLGDKLDIKTGVEYNPKIAEWSRNNNDHPIATADIRDFDFTPYADSDYFHASPVCKNYSEAKAQQGEVALDMETAQAVARGLEVIKPKVFTVENVPKYMNSEAVQVIEAKLKELGYKWDKRSYNSADFGVPQSRNRMLLRAVREGELPPPPKAKAHVGWYDAVKDLDLSKGSSLAAWQKDRLTAKGQITVRNPIEAAETSNKAVNGTSTVATKGAYAPRSYSAETVEATIKTGEAYNAKTKEFSQDKMSRFAESLRSVAARIHNDIGRLGYKAIQGAEVLKENGDPRYPVSQDFTTNCRRRYALRDTLDAIISARQKVFGAAKAMLGPDEIMQVRGDLEAAGHEVNCGPCYVESRRINLETPINKAIEGYTRKEKFRQLTPENAVRALTQAGRDWMFEHDKAQYDVMAGALAGTNIKAPIGRAAYSDEYLKVSQDTIDKMNQYSGARSQSWSDFEIPHMLDKMQAVMHQALRKLKGQSYTKEIEYVELMKDTNEAINQSWIPKGLGLDKDGNLVWNEKQSIRDMKRAMEIRDKYDNVGNEAIGVTDAHILKLLDADTIDYVIPNHDSGLANRFKESAGTKGWKDYSDEQSWMRKDGKGKAGLDPEATAKEDVREAEWDALSKESRTKLVEEFKGRDNPEAMARMKNGKAAWEKLSEKERQRLIETAPVELFADEWKGDLDKMWEIAEKRGVIPPFERFSDHKNYHKLLVDRRIFDKNGKFIEQKPLHFEFDMDYVKKSLDEYKGGHDKNQTDTDIVAKYAKRTPEEIEATRMTTKDVKRRKDAAKAAKAAASEPADMLTQMKDSASKSVLSKDADAFKSAVKSLPHGKQLPDSMYVHKAGLSGPLRSLVAGLQKQHGLGEEFNLIKFGRNDHSVSFLEYANFESDPHPALAKAVSINLSTGKVTTTDFSGRANRPILHRKESFIPSDHPDAAKFKALSDAEAKAGLLGGKAGGSGFIGYEKQWNDLLKSKGLSIKDHKLSQQVGTGKPKFTEEELVKNAGRTATTRGTSTHARALTSIVKGKSVIEWGQGKGDDVKYYKGKATNVQGYDPAHQPVKPKGKAQVVTNTFIGNVLAPKMRHAMWKEAFDHATEKMHVAVRSEPGMVGEPIYDGLLMGPAPSDGSLGTRTFQRFYRKGELVQELQKLFPDHTVEAGPRTVVNEDGSPVLNKHGRPLKLGNHVMTAVVIRKGTGIGPKVR